MKNKNKVFSLLLAFCILASVLCTPALATTDMSKSEEQVIYSEDGSYAVITITYDTPHTIFGRYAAKKTSGAKEYIYYNNADQPLWTFRVHGSFEYDGNSVEAIDADYSQSVHVSFWSFVSASAYCSGASAVANGTFKKGVAPVSKIITLTCSKDGKLS